MSREVKRLIDSLIQKLVDETSFSDHTIKNLLIIIFNEMQGYTIDEIIEIIERIEDYL